MIIPIKECERTVWYKHNGDTYRAKSYTQGCRYYEKGRSILPAKLTDRQLAELW